MPLTRPLPRYWHAKLASELRRNLSWHSMWPLLLEVTRTVEKDSSDAVSHSAEVVTMRLIRVISLTESPRLCLDVDFEPGRIEELATSPRCPSDR